MCAYVAMNSTLLLNFCLFFWLLVMQIGDEVAISTTSYNASETEKRWITAVSANSRVLTLNQPLSYTHIGQ